MTIRERFAKYSTKELEDGIKKLNIRIEEQKTAMDEFKAEKNIELYRQAESLYNDNIERLMDAELALTGRING